LFGNPRFLIWLIPTGSAAVVSLPIIVLGRRRVQWRAWELLALILPFCVWLVLPYCFPQPSTAKGWGNLAEPFYFNIGIPVAALLRVAIGKSVRESACAAVLIALLCVVAAIVHFVTPNLGGHL
jgi:hypothetical protein